MAGRTEPIKPAPDAKGICAKGCRALARRLGFDEDEVWFVFAQLAMETEYLTRWPRPCAEWHAMQMLEQIYDKRGALPS